MAAVAVAIVASLILANFLLGTPRPTGPTISEEPPLPAPGDGAVLAQSSGFGVSPLFDLEFNVSQVTSSFAGPYHVELAAAVNVSCGGASYWPGADYSCDLSLVSGPLGGPTVDQLWAEHFNGTLAVRNSSLPVGEYHLLLNVAIGSPPAAVLFTNYNVAEEAILYFPFPQVGIGAA